MAERMTNVSYFIGLLLSTIVLLGLLIVCNIANIPASKSIGINATVGDVSDDFNTYFTPIDATFAIWYLVFGWQVIWVGYAWTFVLKARPIMISPKALQFYSFANLFAIVWLVLWVNEIPQFTFPVVIICTLLMYFSVSVQAIFIYQNTSAWMHSKKLFKYDLTFVRFIALNGIMIYTVWLTLVTLLNFTIVIEYFSNASKTTAGVVSLVLFVLLFLSYFNLENTILDPLLRYVITVYPVLIWASYGIVRKLSFEFPDLTGIAGFATFCFALVVFLQGFRIILIAIFSYKKPIKYPNRKRRVISTIAVFNRGTVVPITDDQPSQQQTQQSSLNTTDQPESVNQEEISAEIPSPQPQKKSEKKQTSRKPQQEKSQKSRAAAALPQVQAAQEILKRSPQRQELPLQEPPLLLRKSPGPLERPPLPQILEMEPATLKPSPQSPVLVADTTVTPPPPFPLPTILQEPALDSGLQPRATSPRPASAVATLTVEPIPPPPSPTMLQQDIQLTQAQSSYSIAEQVVEVVYGERSPDQ